MRESVAVLRPRNAHYEVNARVRCSPSSAVAVLPKCALRGNESVKSFVRGRAKAFRKCASPFSPSFRGRLLRPRSPYSRNAHYEVNARVRCSPSSAVAVLPKCALRGKCASPLQSFVRGRLLRSAVAVLPKCAKCAVRVLRPRSPSPKCALRGKCASPFSPSSAVAVLLKCALRGKCASPLQSFLRGRLLRPRSPYSRNAHYEVNARVRCSPSSAVAVLPKCALRGKCASPLQSFVRGRRTPEMRITVNARVRCILRPRSPYSRNAHYEVNARVRCSPSSAVAVLPKCALRGKCASPLQSFLRGRLLPPRSPYSRNAHYEVNARVRCSPSFAVAVLPKCALRGKCASPKSAVALRNAHYEVNARVRCSPSSAVAVLPKCALRVKKSFLRAKCALRVLPPRSPYSRNAHYEVNARVSCSPSSAVAVLPKCALRGKCASPLQSFRPRSPYSRNAHYEVNARVRCSPSFAVRGRRKCSSPLKCALRGKCASPLQSFVRGRLLRSAVAVLLKCALRGKCASPLSLRPRSPSLKCALRVLPPRSPYSRNAHYEVNARVRCSPSSAVAVLPKCALRNARLLRGRSRNAHYEVNASPLQSFLRGRLLRSRSPYSRNAHYELNARVRCMHRNAHRIRYQRERLASFQDFSVVPRQAQCGVRLRKRGRRPNRPHLRGSRVPAVAVSFAVCRRRRVRISPPRPSVGHSLFSVFARRIGSVQILQFRGRLRKLLETYLALDPCNHNDVLFPKPRGTRPQRQTKTQNL
ncbi:unnamed protein product [Acanthosepion pharaonis]|uniref:Uncharacterized protein n=1 Tax=Acanthosepion pharaonis TaxID=158019 RepID=A0A812EIV7_ACAPH|nr:unnamed protein product [Sepia pharaonis]